MIMDVVVVVFIVLSLSAAGSSHCFLFSLKPIMDVYYPTGYNSNFIYVNQNQQTLPNGLV